MSRRTRALLLPVLTLAPALLAGACSGDDEGGAASRELTAQEQEYADAFARDLADEDDGFGVSAGAGECIGAAIMDILTAEPFEAAGVEPADLGGDESPGQLLGEGTVTEEQAEQITDAWNDCVDLARQFAIQAGDEFDLDAEGLECFEEALEDAGILDEYLQVSFRRADPRAGNAVLQRIVSIVQGCTRSEAGKGGVLVESIASSLTQDGRLNVIQARCVAQELVDTVGADRLIVLTGNGDLSSVPAERQEEFAAAILAATEACDVPLEQLR